MAVLDPAVTGTVFELAGLFLLALGLLAPLDFALDVGVDAGVFLAAAVVWLLASSCAICLSASEASTSRRVPICCRYK